MYSYIKGKIAAAGDGYVVIDNNGIGYECLVSGNTFHKCGEVGREVKLYTYFRAGEDGVWLFGFSDIEEKNMFLKLITVSGVGPKAALTVLSGMSLNDLAVCIATEDSKALTKVKGIGKKTAERIILELKEKVNQSLVADGNALPIGGVRTGESDEAGEAVIALMALGFSKAESLQSVQKAVSLGAKRTEDIIGFALKSLN